MTDIVRVGERDEAGVRGGHLEIILPGRTNGEYEKRGSTIRLQVIRSAGIEKNVPCRFEQGPFDIPKEAL